MCDMFRSSHHHVPCRGVRVLQRKRNNRMGTDVDTDVDIDIDTDVDVDKGIDINNSYYLREKDFF